ncbi:hypothetical protein MRB53_039021 [Persea americana]|nr:hypothetical protein MRB53_039021 [Persea americana]
MDCSACLRESKLVLQSPLACTRPDFRMKLALDASGSVRDTEMLRRVRCIRSEIDDRDYNGCRFRASIGMTA